MIENIELTNPFLISGKQVADYFVEYVLSMFYFEEMDIRKDLWIEDALAVLQKSAQMVENELVSQQGETAKELLCSIQRLIRSAPLGEYGGVYARDAAGDAARNQLEINF